MNSTNADIRNKAKGAGVKLWQIAECYGLHECTLSRKLRHELPQEEKDKILSIVEELAREREQEAC